MADEDIKSNSQPIAEKPGVESPVGEVVPEQPKTENVEIQSGVEGAVSEPSVVVDSPVVEIPTTTPADAVVPAPDVIQTDGGQVQTNSPEFIPESISNTNTPAPELTQPTEPVQDTINPEPIQNTTEIIPNTPTNPIPEITKPEPTPVIPEVAAPITTTPTTTPVVPVVNTDVPALTNPTIRTYLMGLLVKANSAIQVRKQKKLQNILALFDTMPKVQNDDVEKKLHISDTMATQYLATLVRRGHIKRAGTGRNTYYFKP